MKNSAEGQKAYRQIVIKIHRKFQNFIASLRSAKLQLKYLFNPGAAKISTVPVIFYYMISVLLDLNTNMILILIENIEVIPELKIFCLPSLGIITKKRPTHTSAQQKYRRIILLCCTD